MFHWFWLGYKPITEFAWHFHKFSTPERGKKLIKLSAISQSPLLGMSLVDTSLNFWKNSSAYRYINTVYACPSSVTNFCLFASDFKICRCSYVKWYLQYQKQRKLTELLRIWVGSTKGIQALCHCKYYYVCGDTCKLRYARTLLSIVIESSVTVCLNFVHVSPVLVTNKSKALFRCWLIHESDPTHNFEFKDTKRLETYSSKDGYCVVPENIHTHPKDGILVWIPPPRWKFQFSFIPSFKTFWPLISPSTLEFPMTILGVGMDIFWSPIFCHSYYQRD